MYQQRNGRQLMFIGIGVILIVLVGAYFLTRGGGSSGASTPSGPPSSNVLVALQAIPQGTTFQAGQPLDTFFAVRHVPNSIIPFGAYSSLSQVNNLIKSLGCQPANSAGCRGTLTVTQTIYQNLPVVSGMFSTLGQFRLSAGPAFQIPYGYVTIGVSFSTVNSVIGSINAGDDIDLMASLTGLEGTSGKVKVPTQTQYVMNDLRVIGVNGPPASPSTTTVSPGSSSSTSSSSASQGGGQLLLLVRYQQALIIQHLKDFGGSWSISAVLRSSKETDIPHFKSLPVTERWFFVKQDNKFDWTNPY